MPLSFQKMQSEAEIRKHLCLLSTLLLSPHAQQDADKPCNHAHLGDKCVKNQELTFHTEHCHSLAVCCRCCCSLLGSTECLTLPKWLCTFGPPRRGGKG